MEEMAGTDYNRRLKFFPGKTVADTALEILLVSISQKYLEELQKNLYITRQVQSEKRPYNLKVHICKSIKDVLDLQSDEFTIDFISFILQVNDLNCFTQVRENLDLLDPSFCKGRLCLINPDPGYDNSVVKPFQVWNFARKFQMNLINGRTDNPERTTNLSKRILNLAELSSGFVNGVPLTGFV